MLEMLRDLISHKGHASAALLTAICQNRTAASDPELWQLLHHILLAIRFWLLTVLALPFATEDDLARILEDALIPNGKCSVSQAFQQACMHSHGHRAQCATLLRRHGGMPPPMDFIQWLMNRPKAEWAGAV